METRLARLELKPSRRGAQGAGWEVAEVLIDGTNLVEILREIERPLAEAEGKPELAGQYDGLPALVAFHPSRQYLGEAPKEMRWMGYPPGKLPVLGCNCGEVECWPSLARITVSETTVSWDDFENLYRGTHSPYPGRPVWTYEQLGRLVFDRSQYDAALRSYVPLKHEKRPWWRRHEPRIR